MDILSTQVKYQWHPAGEILFCYWVKAIKMSVACHNQVNGNKIWQHSVLLL